MRAELALSAAHTHDLKLMALRKYEVGCPMDDTVDGAMRAARNHCLLKGAPPQGAHAQLTLRRLAQLAQLVPGNRSSKGVHAASCLDRYSTTVAVCVVGVSNSLRHL